MKVGARGSTVPVGSLYGYASGVVGLRLFPNPDFDDAAKAKWDAAKYFKGDDALVRPYRVGMSCGFCHVGPSPVHPPADPANPQWADLSSTVGAQYMWVDRLFIYRANPDNYFFQLVHTYRPGAMDTSLVSTDYINNPRTMNAVYSLGDRLTQALRWGRETLAGGQLNNKQFNDYLAERTADAVLPEAEHLVDAAGAEGRFRFRGCAGRAEPRLSEHRAVQRGVAAALQSGDRRQADQPDPNRERGEELQLLAGDGSLDTAHGAGSSCRRRSLTG